MALPLFSPQQGGAGATMSAPRWTPELVEELLFRQFCKGEDVTSLLPPKRDAPQPLAADMDDSIRCLMRFAQNGPTILSSGANTAGAAGSSKNGPMTPTSKGAALQQQAASSANAGATPRTPTAKPPIPTQQGAKPAVGASLPLAPAGAAKNNMKQPSPTLGRKGPSEEPGSATKKRRREPIIWPTGVPTDAQLKSQSRSAVQHLTERRVAYQDSIDPDLIFKQNPGEFPIASIFARYPDAAKAVLQRIRGSGDWRTDSFTAAEEREYKETLGFTAVGPSQAVPVIVQPGGAPTLTFF